MYVWVTTVKEKREFSYTKDRVRSFFVVFLDYPWNLSGIEGGVYVFTP